MKIIFRVVTVAIDEVRVVFAGIVVSRVHAFAVVVVTHPIDLSLAHHLA